MNLKKIEKAEQLLFQIEEIVLNKSQDGCCTIILKIKEHHQDDLKGIKSIINCSWNSIALN